MSKKTSKVVGTGGVWEPEGWSWQDLMRAAAPGGSKAEGIEKWPGLRPLFDPEFELPKSAKKVGRLMLALCYSLANYVDTKFTGFEERRASVFAEAVKLNEASKANDIEELRTSAKHLANAMVKHEADLAALRERSDLSGIRGLLSEHEKDLSEIRTNALGGLHAAGEAVAEVKKELGETAASHHRLISELQKDTTTILAAVNDLRLAGSTRQKIQEEIAGLKREVARLKAAERFAANSEKQDDDRIAQINGTISNLVDVSEQNKSNALGGGNFANWAAGQRATTSEAVAACDGRIDALSGEVEEIGQAVAELNQRLRNVSLVAMAIEQVTGQRLDREPALYSSAVEERFNQLLERVTEGAPAEAAPNAPGSPVVQLEKISDVDDEDLKRVRLEAQKQAEQLAAQPDAVMAAIRRQSAASAGPLPPDAMPEGVSAAGLFQQALSEGPEADEAGKRLAEILLDPARRIEAVREKAGKP